MQDLAFGKLSGPDFSATGPSQTGPYQYQTAYARRYKRLLDLVLSILILPPVAVVILLLYPLVRLDGGAGFFVQDRIGHSGRSFRCYKLRSMRPDAAAQLPEILSANQALLSEWEAGQKLKLDPRVTLIGFYLRRFSLDELPQIWNVLRGDMSLVGPRPVPLQELGKYGHKREIYEAMRPGITGLWQVSGRNRLSYEARVGLDEVYFRNLTLGMDIRVLLKTAVVFLRPNGC